MGGGGRGDGAGGGGEGVRYLKFTLLIRNTHKRLNSILIMHHSFVITVRADRIE